MEVLAILAVLWSLFITIFWLVIGFRAMRAHELLADRLKLTGKAIEKIASAIEQHPDEGPGERQS